MDDFMIAALVVITIVVAILIVLIRKCFKDDYSSDVTYENVLSGKLKTSDEFEKIYEELYEKNIKSLEQKRKKVMLRTILQNAVLVWFVYEYMCNEIGRDFLFTGNEYGGMRPLLVIVLLALYVIFVYSNHKYKKQYVLEYKKEIITNFINILNDKLKYTPVVDNAFGVQAEYEQVKFDKKNFNRFYVDDHIEGNLDEDTFADMYDIHIQNVVRSGKHTHTEEIFKGIFAISNCKKDIGTTVKVSKNKMKILSNKDIIQMDSEEFEKYFDVYSEDKITAMRLLTSDIMETLINFHNKYGLEFEIVFKQKKIYLRFFTGAMFEPKVFGGSMDKELIATYYNILQFIIEITRKVNEVQDELDV